MPALPASSRVLLWADADGSVERGRVVDVAVVDDERDAVDVGDAARRVAVDEDYVCEFAGGDRAQLRVALHHARRAERRDAQHVGGGDARLRVQLPLSMQG